MTTKTPAYRRGPYKAPQDRKSCSVRVPLSPVEAAQLERLAERLELSMAATVRRAVDDLDYATSQGLIK